MCIAGPPAHHAIDRRDRTLVATTASAAIGVPGFLQRLRELGWIEGRTLAIEYRWADARAECFAEIADEFVRLNVDVIVIYGAPPVIAVKQATSVIPIVIAPTAIR